MPGLDLGGQAGTQIIGELVKTVKDGDNALLLLKVAALRIAHITGEYRF